MSTDITFPASVGNVRKGCQSSALQSLTKPSYPALARYRPLRYLRSCSDSALEDWAGSPSAAGASVISTSTIGVAGSSDAWKNRTSETFERCAGMAAGAVSDRMSHMRIVSSPEPVAIWYLMQCQSLRTVMKQCNLPVRRETDGKYALDMTVQNHGSLARPQVPNTTNSI